MGEIWESSNEAMLFRMFGGGTGTKVPALCLPSFCESNLSKRKFDWKLRFSTVWDAEIGDQSLIQVSAKELSNQREGMASEVLILYI